MADVKIRPYAPHDFADVAALWREAFPDYEPRNRAEHSIPEKLKFQPDLFLVAEAGGGALGTAMAGYDGHRGWLYSVAVLKSARRQGVGTALLRAAEARLAALGCAKINLQVEAPNEAVVGFYEKLGYKVEPRVSMGKIMAPSLFHARADEI